MLSARRCVIESCRLSLVDFDHDFICSSPDLRDAIVTTETKRDLELSEDALDDCLDPLFPPYGQPINIRAADWTKRASVTSRQVRSSRIRLHT